MKNKSKLYTFGIAATMVAFLLSSCVGTRFDVAKYQKEREFTTYKAIDKKQDKSERGKPRPAKRNKHTW